MKTRSEKSEKRKERRDRAAARKDPQAIRDATESRYSRGDAVEVLGPEQLRRATLDHCESLFRAETGTDWEPRGKHAQRLRVLLAHAHRVHQRELRAAQAIRDMHAAWRALRRVAREDWEEPFPQLDGASLVDNAATPTSAIAWAQRMVNQPWTEALDQGFSRRAGGYGVGALAVDRQRLAFYLNDWLGADVTWQVVTAVWLLLDRKNWPEPLPASVKPRPAEVIKHVGKVFKTDALARARAAADPVEKAMVVELTEAIQEQLGGKKKT